MKKGILIFLFPFLVSCAHHVKLETDYPIVKDVRGAYRITQAGPRTYVVHAWTLTDAEAAAKKELNCGREICLMTPGGVIIMVEKPAKK